MKTQNNSSEDIASILGSLPLFANLGPEELAIVAKYTARRRLPAGELLFREGGRSSSMYIIEDGEVVLSRGEGEDHADVAGFIKGESFGELSLFRDSRHSVSAMAVRDTSLLYFPGDDVTLEEISDRHPGICAEILYHFISILDGRIRDVNGLIAERTPWLNELRGKLYTDRLTGLLNRTYLESEVAAAPHTLPLPVSVLMIKPDDFKYVNDSFGHDAGDAALIRIARLLGEKISPGFTAARYRGDEFTVIMPAVALEEALGNAEDIARMLYNMDISDILGGERFNMRVSMGISAFSGKSVDENGFIKKAHELMHAARKAGGARIHTDYITEFIQYE